MNIENDLMELARRATYFDDTLRLFAEQGIHFIDDKSVWIVIHLSLDPDSSVREAARAEFRVFPMAMQYALDRLRGMNATDD